MLKLNYLFENYELAKQALSYWNYDTDTVEDLLQQFRISSNAIYPFQQNGKVCFLRLAPVEEKIEQNIFGELEFLQYLIHCNFPALQPIPSKNGLLCCKLTTKWGEYYASAFQKVCGIPLEDLNLTEEIAYQYGKTLGKLHSFSSQFNPNIKKWSYQDVFQWIHFVLKEYHSPEFMKEEARQLEKIYSLLPKDSDNFGLVHYDFELDNVFYDKNTKQCHVIDFDDGMYHWFALDIEQALDSMEKTLSTESFFKLQQAFLQGYQEEHRYTKEMEQSRPWMRRFIDLYQYARLIRSVAETLEEEPDWMITLRQKLNQVILEKEKNITIRL